MAKGTPMAVFSMLACSLVMSAAEKLTIHLVSPFISAGGSQRVTCRVPRDDRNRELEVGIEDYQQSGHQLDGVDARITYEAWFYHIPCEAGRAYCRVTRNDGTTERVVAAMVMSGCDLAHDSETNR